MNVAITGGAGYLGTVVTGYLLGTGQHVTVIDRMVYGGESLLGFYGYPGFCFRKGDVRERDSLRQAFSNADAVVHLAAVVGEPACARDESGAWSVNYNGVQCALAAARDAGIQRFIFVSTCSNYGISDPGETADEDYPLRPISQYACSKVEAERHILENAGSLSVVILRLGTICGLSGRMRFDLLVGEMARSAVLREPIRIFAPAAWRPFLHIRDAARAIADCLIAPEARVRGKVFNVVGENCQKAQLAGLVRKHYADASITVTDKQPDLRDYRATGDRIRRELGFVPQFTVEDAFLETAAAVADGVFRDPHWAGHSAVPLEPARQQGD